MSTNRIIVEFSDEDGHVELLSRNIEAVTQRSSAAVGQAMTVIKDFANAALSTLKTLEVAPEQSEIEFGIVFKAEAGAVVAKAASEASVKVKLVWKPRHNS
jgi:hypothetical protein